MATTVEPEIIGDGVEVPGTMLSQITRSEIDIQIATAKRYPRSITTFKRRTEELACLDEETAATMFYVIPRDGKKIEGPSVRFAEVIGSTWGNLRYGSRIIETDDHFITAQGACHDLETNNAVTVEIRRRITNKRGERFSDDMIQVTGNAACSIALRQAIFKVVPFALAKEIYNKAKQTAVGKASSMQETRRKAIDWFIKAHASQEQVLEFLERKSIDDVTMDDIIILRGLRTAISDGEIKIEEALRPRDTREPGSKSSVRQPEKKPDGPTLQPEPQEEALATLKNRLDHCHGETACNDLAAEFNDPDPDFNRRVRELTDARIAKIKQPPKQKNLTEGT